MAFNPKSEYTIVPSEFGIKDFYSYKEDYVTRPPYQRKAVWPKHKKQSLMDSLFRRYYVPRLVIREVRLEEDRTVNEIIDGQQRITTVQDFFANKFPLPKSLSSLNKELVGKYYKDLDTEVRKFIDKSLKFQADVIKNIEEPNNTEHQIIATEIFWRLQQGETLNYMEVAHAQLSSLARNFIVKYSDDQTFDYENYQPLDSNPDKLPFFLLLAVPNDRMKHLQFMARFLLIEIGNGYAHLGEKKITEFIDESKTEDGIGDYSYEQNNHAQESLKTLRVFYDIFKEDPMHAGKHPLKELSVEYFIISVYLLVRHLRKHYVMDDGMKTVIREFIYSFHTRWKTFDEGTDSDLLKFSISRQQGENELELRDRLLRQLFFEFLFEIGVELTEKDGARAFNEHQRIVIYRRDKGVCQQCKREGKPDLECKIEWPDYHADHIVPHSKGGKTDILNGELLCRTHNLKKSDKMPAGMS